MSEREINNLTRKIIGIENRTPHEVFDIMCDRVGATSRECDRLRAENAELQRRVDEAESDVKRIHSEKMDHYEAKLLETIRADALQAEVDRMREALRFYADPPRNEFVTVPDFYDELDFGLLARQALGGSND